MRSADRHEPLHRNFAKHIDQVFAAMEDITPVVQQNLTHGPARRDRLTDIDDYLLKLLSRFSPLLDGAGIAFAADSLVQTPRWLQWWRSKPDGSAEFTRHVFNSKSLRDYDYADMPWYAIPAQEGRSVAVGPYYDSAGTDRNVVTLAVPCPTSRGISVIASDLHLPALEREFRAQLPEQSRNLVLANGNRRVIASQSAQYPAGSLVPQSAVAQSFPVVSVDRDRLPWTVVSTVEET